MMPPDFVGYILLACTVFVVAGAAVVAGLSWLARKLKSGRAPWREREARRYGYPSDGGEVPLSQRFPSVDQLRPYRGLWVAVKAGQVIHSADELASLLASLKETGVTADSTFRVPGDEPRGRQ